MKCRTFELKIFHAEEQIHISTCPSESLSTLIIEGMVEQLYKGKRCIQSIKRMPNMGEFPADEVWVTVTPAQ